MCFRIMFRNCLVKVNACFQLGHMEQQLEKLLDTVMSSCRYVVLHILDMEINCG